MGSLTGRVVAVTGGARGIGAEIARQLASAGAQVAIGDRDLDAVTATAAGLPDTVHGFALDVTDSESFRGFLTAAEALLGPIDVLVNNAGVMWVGPFDEEAVSVDASREHAAAVEAHEARGDAVVGDAAVRDGPEVGPAAPARGRAGLGPTAAD